MNGPSLRVCVAGVTGWAGSALARGIVAAEDMQLVAGVSRRAAGRSVADALQLEECSAPVCGSMAEALAASADVVVEYTLPEVARDNVLAALGAGCHVVIGTSGLTDDDFAAIDEAAQNAERGVLACGNFSLTAVLMMKFSQMAARWIPNWEVLDYAHAGKVDAPSGTARELVHRLAQVGEAELQVPLDQLKGEAQVRGARMSGTQVHSVRLPGHVIAIESIFGMDSEKLVMRHEAGSSATPYVGGALLAIRGVASLVGLHRGLDTVMPMSD